MFPEFYDFFWMRCNNTSEKTKQKGFLACSLNWNKVTDPAIKYSLAVVRGSVHMLRHLFMGCWHGGPRIESDLGHVSCPLSLLRSAFNCAKNYFGRVSIFPWLYIFKSVNHSHSLHFSTGKPVLYFHPFFLSDV